MAIYHLSMKTVSRSAGRSSTAAAAYRAGCQITDQRTGEVHDYRRKGGVQSADIVMPEGVGMMERADLWNGVEAAHKRGDATVAREFEVALPDELSPADRRRLAVDFSREVANHYGVAADVCVHEPSKEGDERNHHAHILLTACTLSASGFGKKAAELDPIHCQRHKIANPADLWRGRWAELTNERLLQAGVSARVDHRSLEAQGIDREPSIHLGPSVMGMKRRGADSEVQKRLDAEVASRLLAAQQQGQRERELEATRQSMIDLSMDIAAAKADRLAAKVAAAELRLDSKLVQREQAAQRAAELARQEQQRMDAERKAVELAELRRKVDEARPIIEARNEKMRQEAAERQRLEHSQRLAPAKKPDRGYEPGF